MASNVVSIAVQADSSQLQTAFDKGATAGERFKAKMGLVAKAVVAALAIKAAQAITDFVGDSIEAFSDLNESLNAVEVTFGRNAEGIKKLGEEAAGSLGLSNAEFNSFAVQMSAFAEEIAGDGGDVVGVVDQLSTRVSDFASVMNLEVADAATKFQSGLAGETEPLRKFGIDVSAARVEMFALANGIVETGEEMTEAQKIQARFGTIMEQTAEVQGDFANTATDYANAQRIANAEMENAKARAGEALIPFAQLTTQLKTLGAEAIGVFSSQILALTGQMEDVDSHIQQFEIHMGESADTAASALTIVKEYGGSFDELIPRLDLSREELEKLRDADEDFLESMGFTEEQISDVARVANNELIGALTDSEQAARDAFAGMEELGPELKEVSEEAQQLADDYAAAMKEMSGVSEREWSDITGDVESFITGFKEAPEQIDITMEEFITNIVDRRQQAEDFFNGLAKLAEMGLGALANEIEQEGPAALGVLEEYLADPARARIDNAIVQGAEEGVAGAIAAYTGTDWPDIGPLDLKVLAPSIQYQQRANQVTPVNSGQTVLHEGGIVTEGLLDGNRSSRQEAVIPLDTQEGKRALARAVAEAMDGSGPQILISGDIYGFEDFEEKVTEAIIRARRRAVDV